MLLLTSNSHYTIEEPITLLLLWIPSGAPLGHLAYLAGNWTHRIYYKCFISYKPHFPGHFSFWMNLLACMEQVLYLFKHHICEDIVSLTWLTSSDNCTISWRNMLINKKKSFAICINNINKCIRSTNMSKTCLHNFPNPLLVSSLNHKYLKINHQK